MSELDALLRQVQTLPQEQAEALQARWLDLRDRATRRDAPPTDDPGELLLAWGLLRGGSAQATRHWPHALLQGPPSALRAGLLLRFVEQHYPSRTSFYREDHQGPTLAAFEALRDHMPQALRGFDSRQPRPHREELLLFLCATLAARDNQPFLLALARDAEAEVRRAALDALLADPQVDLEPVAALLRAPRKAHRLDAAQAVGRHPHPSLVAALTAALAAERTEAVFAALASALDACARLGDGPRPDLADLAWDAPPTLLRKLPAPCLRLRGGAPAPPERLRGLLTLLRAESEHQHNPHLGHHLAHFHRGDLEALGEDIFQLWSGQRSNQAQRWGTYQLVHTASPGYLVWMARDLRQSLGPPQDFWAKLQVLGRHNSPLGHQGLAWALEQRVSRMARHHQEEARATSPLLLAPGGLERATGRYLANNSEALHLLKKGLLELRRRGLINPTSWEVYRLRGAQAELVADKLHSAELGPSVRHERGGHAVHLRLACPDPPVLGELSMEPRGELVDMDPQPASDREVERQLAQLRDQFAARARDELSRLATALGSPALACWTWPTWRKLTHQLPAQRLLLRGWLFAQPGGPAFGLDADFEPATLDGQPLALDPWGLIEPCDLTTLTPDQRRAWQQRLRHWHQERLQRRPAPVRLSIDDFDTNRELQDLRALLYEEPSPTHWARLVQALHRWRDAGSLPMAVDYLRRPLQEGWRLRRSVPRQWLTDPDASDIPLRYAPGQDPRLALCNTWTWRHAQDRDYKTRSWTQDSPLRHLTSLEMVGPRGNQGRQLAMDQATFSRVLDLPCWQDLRRLTLELSLPRYMSGASRSYRAFARLRSLWIYGTRNNAQALLRWLEQGALPHLEEVTFHKGRAAEALALLVEEADLSQLKRLAYTARSRGDARLWRALLANPTAQGLTSLSTNTPEPLPEALRAQIMGSALPQGVKAAAR